MSESGTGPPPPQWKQPSRRPALFRAANPPTLIHSQGATATFTTVGALPVVPPIHRPPEDQSQCQPRRHRNNNEVVDSSDDGPPSLLRNSVLDRQDDQGGRSDDEP